MIEEDKISNPFDKPFVDNYCSENEAKVYLTKEDITELGFLRSDPINKRYEHKDITNLFLEYFHERDYGVKDIFVDRIEVYTMKYGSFGQVWTQTVHYNTTKPYKENIQQIINNYAT